MNQPVNTNIQAKIDEDLSPTKRLTGFHLKIVSAIAIIWSFFQLWYASPFPFMFDFGMFKGLPARAIHLGFALLLAFLVFPTFKRGKVNFIDIMIGIIGISCCLYIYFFYDDLIDRGGVLHILKYNNYSIPIELIIGSTGILILLEATRRVIGIPLVVIAVCFLLFSYYGQYAPEIISHGGLSLKRLVGFQWFDQEAIFGIPIGVSVDFIFLFVLFGAFLEKAGAIEVASSVNGQIMPPVMGAAAFVMASFIGVTYFEIVKHAFLPAIISYIALFYISHLEALKLGLKGIEADKLPKLKETFLSGLHFLIPIFVLIYLLVYLRLTASYSIFYATISLVSVNFLYKVITSRKNNNLKENLSLWWNETVVGLQKGAINMIAVGVAIATAGVIVGAVGSTGLSTNLIIVIESIAKDNVIILLLLTIILCLLLGMGLPTTANYVVVASLMSMVLVDVGNASGYIFPIIAVHLFVFYFGLMADVTPPVGLASYAAAGISGGDPLKTGVQALWYSLRTGVLPIVFLFNHELLLIGIENIWHAILVIITSLIGILVFSAATQGWFINKLRWFEIIIFFVISISFLSPEFALNKFYPKFNYVNLNDANIVTFQPEKDVHIKITRPSPYGERYKLFEIKKGTFDEEFNLENYGMSLIKKDDKIVVDTLNWKGEAKKSGLEMDDIITELKTENFDRPNKDVVYVFSLILLIVFGYFNYTNYRIRKTKTISDIQ